MKRPIEGEDIRQQILITLNLWGSQIERGPGNGNKMLRKCQAENRTVGLCVFSSNFTDGSLVVFGSVEKLVLQWERTEGAVCSAHRRFFGCVGTTPGVSSDSSVLGYGFCFNRLAGSLGSPFDRLDQTDPRQCGRLSCPL